MKLTRQSAARIFTALWVLGTVLSGFLLSVPPARVPIFLGLAAMTLVPLVFGSRYYKVFGIMALSGSLFLAYAEHEAGLRHKVRMEKILKAISDLQKTNTTTSSPQP